MLQTTIEQTTIWEGWLEEEWAQTLAPLLTGELQLAYYALPPALAEDYPHLKEQIFGCCKFSVCQATAESHHWIYQANFNPLEPIAHWADLKPIAHWLCGALTTKPSASKHPCAGRGEAGMSFA